MMGPLAGPIVISGLLFACGGEATLPPDAAAPLVDAASMDAPAPEIDAAHLVAAPDAGADHPDARDPYPRPQYTRLSETGLWSDPQTRALAPGLQAFVPNHILWSDGADKRRWVALAPEVPIDSSEPERWRFPIGTRFWKQFARDGVLLETRLIERYGPGREDFWMGAFVWNAEQTEAVFVENGQANINGTSHDAPAQKQCWSCHLGEPGRILGFSAVQLAGTGPGVRLQALVDARLLTHPPARTDYQVPGPPVVAAALGYLHANCGHCHNPLGTSWPDTQMNLRLETTSTTPEATAVYQTAVGRRLQYFRHPTISDRVVPGDPAASALYHRMSVRQEKVSMPSLATKLVDPTGLEVVRRWIEALPRP